MSDQPGSNDLPAEDTSFLHNLLEPLQSLDWINLGWFAGVVFALVVLFAAGLKVPARLAFASFLMLFVELALIRWVGANNVFVNNASNFVLLASFLGIGIGFLNARSGRDYVRWTPVALLVLVGFVLAFPVVVATLGGPNPYPGRGGMHALRQPLGLTIVFVLVVPMMAGLGQAVADLRQVPAAERLPAGHPEQHRRDRGVFVGCLS